MMYDVDALASVARHRTRKVAMTLTVTTLHLYPVKGCRGTSPAAAPARERGFAGDRRWMIVDADGHFVSQRSRPPLALITTDLRPGFLELAAPGCAPLLLALAVFVYWTWRLFREVGSRKRAEGLITTRWARTCSAISLISSGST